MRVAWIICVVLVLGPGLFAADSEADAVKRVNQAIEKGKAALLRMEAGNGHWEGQDTTGKLLSYAAEQNGGTTALATLALLNSGMSADDKVIQRALEYLRSLELKRTYVVGLTTMVYAEARQPRDLERIQKNVDWLFSKAIKRNGILIGWGYPHETAYVDGSNTQYALLGLYAAKQAGVKIDDEQWKAIRKLYLDCQKDESPVSAYWRYDLSQDVPQYGPSFTMTVAGLCGLLISGMGINESQQKLDESSGVAANCGHYATNGPVAKGMNWVAARFSLEKAENMKMSAMYNIYGIERLGRISGQRFIGKYDWYREGCKFLLEKQNDDGTWTRTGKDAKVADRVPVVATSFGLLFLSKGRTPILLTKFAHGDAVVRDGVIVERGEAPDIVGWNRKQNDARNLVEFASRELFNGLPLGWQVYDSRKVTLNDAKKQEEIESLLACPIIYFNGHGPIVLTKAQEEILQRYVDEGGFLFAEACCGDVEFANSFETLMKKLFRDNQLINMPPAHPIWYSFFQVSPQDFPEVKCLERGCKTVVVFTKTPMAGYWEEARFAPVKGKPATSRGQRAYQFAGNVIAYATGMQPPEQRGTRKLVIDPKNEITPPRGAFKPAQLRLRDEPPPAPAAMRNLMAYIGAATSIDAALNKADVGPGDPELAKFKFVYLHGRRKLALDAAEIKNLKEHLETDGLLFADAACGKKEFDESFRALMKQMFPDKPLEVIPPDDDLFSEKVNSEKLRSVKRREKADGAGPDGGYRELPPHLEGIKIDGRWAVIYSKWDVGCALEKHNSTECLGHNPDSALKVGTAVVLYSLKR